MRILKIMGWGLLVLSLAACSKLGTKGVQSSATGAGGTAAATQSYGVASPGDFQGQPINNRLLAPQNQSYYFNFDGTALASNDTSAINAQANYLIAHPNARIRLAGNTDNRGSREYNIGLGWRRDQAVESLLAQQGVALQQIKMVSYGKEKPIALGNTEAAWAQNRRVDLIYTSK